MYCSLLTAQRTRWSFEQPLFSGNIHRILELPTTATQAEGREGRLHLHLYRRLLTAARKQLVLEPQPEEMGRITVLLSKPHPCA